MTDYYMIIGDVHLGVNKNNPVFFKTTLDYAYWIKELCEKRNIKKIIQLGDIFHNREMVHVSVMNCAHDFFEILKDFEIHITVGNHDCTYNNSSDVNSLKLLKNWPNITVHEKVTSFDGLCFCGWGTKLEDIPNGQKAVFGHFDIKGFEMNAYKISEHGFHASSLMEKCEILFSGHYHKPQVRFYDKKPLIYTGSAYQLNWGESGEKKYAYIFDSGSLKYEMIENEKSPKFVKIKDLSNLCEIENNFVSVEIEKIEDLPETENILKKSKCLSFITTFKNKTDKIVSSENNEEKKEEICTIYDCIDEYVSFLDVDENKKKIVEERLKEIYSKIV